MQRRRRTALSAAIAVAVVGGIAVAGWLYRDRLGDAGSLVEGWSTRLRTIAGEVPARELDDRAGSAESAGVLVAVGDGEHATFAIVSTGPDRPPALTIVPGTLLALLPGYGEFTLAEAMGFEGPELAALAIENRLGIRFDDVLYLPPGSVTAALGGAQRVDVPVALFVDEGGVATRLVPEGIQTVSADLVERLLVDPGSGTTFEWLQRQGASWRVVLDLLARSPATADLLTSGMEVRSRETADLLLALAASPDTLLASLPVVSAPSVTEPLAVVPAETAATFVTQRLGHLAMGEGPRVRVEILNGNGRIGATRVVAGVLIRRGFRVVRTDNADRFDYAATQVIAQGRANEDAGRLVVDALGTGSLFLELQGPSQVVDVSIIVGLDVPSGE